MIKRTMLGFGAIAVASAVALVGAFLLARSASANPAAFSLSADPASITPDGTSTVTLTMTPADGESVGSFHANITYEASQLAVIACTSSFGACNPAFAVGTVAFDGSSLVGLSGGQGKVMFVPASGFTGTASVGVDDTECTDEHGNSITCTGTGTSITVAELTPSPTPTPTPMPTELITPTPFAGPAPYPPYDVTCDYVVNLDDVLDLLRRAAGLEDRPACPPPLITEALPQSDGSSVSLRLDPPFGFSKPGADLTVSIQADIGQGSLGAYRAFVTYDQRELTPTSCSVTCNLAWSADTVALADINVSGWTGTASLASVVFKVIARSGSGTFSLTADQLADALGNPIVDCVSSGAKFEIRWPAPTATASPFPSAPQVTPSPTPTPVPTPPPPSPNPCDYWPPADLGCEGPTTAFVALVVLDYIEYGFNRFPVVCPPTSSPK